MQRKRTMQSKEAIESVRVINVSDIAVLYRQIEELRIQEIMDSIIKLHGNWEGLSLGHICSIWFCYMLSEADHKLSSVEPWVQAHLELLAAISGQDSIRVKDFTDDKLEKVLDYLSDTENWRKISVEISQSSFTVYDIEKNPTIRLDAAPQQGHHSVQESKLFEYGYSKHHNPKLGMLKIMLACMDNEINGFGYPLTHLTVPGSQADDGLYIPIIKECELVLAATKNIGKKLYVGDSKMGSKENRDFIWLNKSDYLVPLSKVQLPDKERVKMIEEQDEKKYKKVYKQDKLGKKQLVAQGFEHYEQIIYEDKEGQPKERKERRVYVKSTAFAKTQQKAIDNKIEKAIKEIEYLLVSKKGKKTLKNKIDLRAAIDAILIEQGVVGLLKVEIKEQKHRKKIKAYGTSLGRVDKWSTFQLQITKNESAIAAKKKLMGWQIYATTVSKIKLDFQKIVWKYRTQNRIESRFNDLRNKVVPLLPIFLQKDNRIEALINLLMICLKVSSVIEYKIAKSLKEQDQELDNIYEGNPKRATAQPTTKRVLKQFKGVSIVIINQVKGVAPIVTMTDLNQTTLKIIDLLGFKSDIYTELPEKIQLFFSRKNFSEI